jgi:hypothetical protein
MKIPVGVPHVIVTPWELPLSFVIPVQDSVHVRIRLLEGNVMFVQKDIMIFITDVYHVSVMYKGAFPELSVTQFQDSVYANQMFKA